ncbi:MAG TPA: hypothetical protein GXZ27_07480 [Thermoanaerobacterales bacterium]|nr:hypothetical protein [Thermoanaerobacterales bacterium]
MSSNKKGWFKKLTPKKTWEQYVNTSVELFISNYMADGITDIEKMCKYYANELPIMFEYEKVLFSNTQIELIGKLITEYVKEYIKEKGGIDKLKLYSVQELDIMLDDMHKDIMKNLKK